jgi:hypothetical protein
MSKIAPFTTRTFIDRLEAHGFLFATGWEKLTETLFRRDCKVCELRMIKGEMIARIFN